ncbi:MAG: hypothetical protein L6R40_003897 [Gallowayella cf. fulva]|nr:MAG: hypothetical protein L6R40_003897 [Xanthomendoza cf. fulva]
MHLISLNDPETVFTDIENLRRRPRASHSRVEEQPFLDGDIGSVLTATNVETFWSSAASPSVDTTTFAVATSKGAMLVGLKGDTAQTWTTQCTWPGDEQMASTLTVDFWNSKLVLAGMRSGKVRLWDLRSDGANVRFQHPSCVRNIKALDDNKVLVAGLRNKMAIYDVRFTKGFPQPLQSSILEASVPFQEFPTYRLGSYLYPGLGFDVHLDMGLIASATEDRKLQIFDWRNSDKDIELGSREEPLALDGHIRCVKFVEDQWSGDGLRLLLAHGTKIDAWAW